MKKSLLIVICLVFFFSLGIANVVYSRDIPANDRAMEVSQAPAHSPVISDEWSLDVPPALPPGKAQIIYIHYSGKPDKPGSPKPPPEPEICYKDEGFFWANASVEIVFEEYFCPIEPGSASQAIVDSFSSWNEILSGISFDVSSTTDYTPPAANGINVVCWRTLIGSGGKAIAVTLITYDSVTKELYDVDMVMNLKYSWIVNTGVDPDIDTGDDCCFDVQNIATHEAGHFLVLGDLYSNDCTEVTMFGYSNIGELKKWTLENEDIEGAQSIYFSP